MVLSIRQELLVTWRGGRVVYGSGLENQRGRKFTVGSNPTLSVSETQSLTGFFNALKGFEQALGAYCPYDPGIQEHSKTIRSMGFHQPCGACSIRAKQLCDAWQKWLRRQNSTLSLYDIRHEWVVRAFTRLPSTSLAAKCMGCTVSAHHNTYHRWLNQVVRADG